MLTACTAITKNYLAFARVLGLSLLEHDPGSRLYVLLADRLEGAFDPSHEPFTLIHLADHPIGRASRVWPSTTRRSSSAAR